MSEMLFILDFNTREETFQFKLLERLKKVQMFNPNEWAADWSDVGFNNYLNLFPFPLVSKRFHVMADLSKL